MSLTTRIVVALGLLALLVWLLTLVRRRQLRGKYALFWFVAIPVLVVLALWPDAAAALIGRDGDGAALGGFLLAAVGVAVLALVHAAWELSRLEERSRVLAEEAALQRARDTHEP